jgi:succinate dehydrogenase/fumarate reductase flavoprotein subunit
MEKKQMQIPELDGAAKKQNIIDEIAAWTKAAHTFEIRARAGKQVGDEAYKQAALKDLERALKMIDAFKEQLQEVELEGHKPS